jgi:hypothetical protein
MSLLPTGGFLPPGLEGMLGGPSWLPQGQRPNPFGMGRPSMGQPQSGIRGLLQDPNFAFALLANSRGQSFGQALGNAGLQAQGMRQQRDDDALRQEYLKAQIARMQQPERGNQPASVAEYEYAKNNGFQGSFQDWIVAGGQTSRPSSVQEWEHYQKLGPEEKRAYLEMKRTPPWKIENIDQVPTVVQGLPGGQVNTTSLSTLPKTAAAAATVKQAESAAGALGTAQGGIAGGIQTKGSNSQTVAGMLDIADPLIDAATGSLVGAGVDKMASVFGKSLSGDQAIAQLKVLQAGLMTNMPRMEGPQSDRDVELYRQAAGEIGDPTVPRERKKAALKTIRAMQIKYAERAAAPMQIFPNGSPEASQFHWDEANKLMDKYAPRK